MEMDFQPSILTTARSIVGPRGIYNYDPATDLYTDFHDAIKPANSSKNPKNFHFDPFSGEFFYLPNSESTNNCLSSNRNVVAANDKYNNNSKSIVCLTAPPAALRDDEQCQDAPHPDPQNSGYESVKALAMHPCFQCGLMCNCDRKNEFPDMLVCTLDHKTIRLPSEIARISPAIRQHLKLERLQREEKLILDGLWDPLTNTFYSDDAKNANSLDLNRALESSEKLMFWRHEPESRSSGSWTVYTYPQNQKKEWVVDLREDGEKIPTMPVSSEQWNIVYSMTYHHLNDMQKLEDSHEFSGLLFKRHRSHRVISFDPFRCGDWEESFFRQINTALFHTIKQVVNDMAMHDLIYMVDKWMKIFCGYDGLSRELHQFNFAKFSEMAQVRKCRWKKNSSRPFSFPLFQPILENKEEEEDCENDKKVSIPAPNQLLKTS